MNANFICSATVRIMWLTYYGETSMKNERVGPTIDERFTMSSTGGKMWQPIAWFVPPILKRRQRQLLATHGPREAGRLSLIIRTLQHKGHPHPVLSRSTSGESPAL